MPLPTGTKRLLTCAALAATAIVFYHLGDRDRPENSERRVFAEPPPVTHKQTSPMAAPAHPPLAVAPDNSPDGRGTPVAGPGVKPPEAQTLPAQLRFADEGPDTETPAAVSSEASAVLTIDGKEVKLGRPDALGVFPRQTIEPGAEVAMRVALPEAAEGDPVAVAVEDGGTLDNRQTVLMPRLDAARAVSFRYRAGTSSGLFRVTLRHPTGVKTVELWVGPELALAENR